MIIKIIVSILIIAYFAIGCIVDGMLNDYDKFSLGLIIFWPVAVGMILLFMFIDMFGRIGKKNKTVS